MILVTVGSSTKPFGRLTGALDRLPAAELVVQHGPNPPPEGAAHAVPFMTFAEILEHVERADVVVSHAGAGSIMCALRAGHTPIVVPRLGRLGETVDDHQADLARALEEAGKVVALWDVDRLPEAIASVPPRRPPSRSSELPIHAAVRAALDGRRV